MSDEAKQTCPRRMNEPGPWDHGEHLDQWLTSRWGGRPEHVWDWPWRPRTCTFCGGVHPDDAIQLLKEGWHVVTTDKAYKRYLEPPGGKLGMEYEGRVFDAGVYVPPWGPVPPVKLYTPHMDGEQIMLFNAALSEQKGLPRGRA